MYQFFITVDKLQYLALLKVAKNFNFLYKYLADNQSLSYTIIPDLYKLMNDFELMTGIKSLEYFANHPTTRKINGLTIQKEFVPLLELIKLIKRVGNNLSYLSLPQWKEISPRCLLKCVPAICHISELNLQRTSCTDTVLASIALNCYQLQNLDVSNCNGVTDEGIHLLFKSSLPNSIVHLNIWKTRVTPNGCLFAMKKLPLLKRLNYHLIEKVLTRLRKGLDSMKLTCFCFAHYQSTFPSKLMFHSIESLGFQPISSKENLKTALIVCPNLKTVTISPNDEDLILLTAQFENINRIQISSALNLRKMVAFTGINRNVTVLHIRIVDEIDINDIGRSFPYLEELNLDNVTFRMNESNTYQACDHVPFECVKKLTITLKKCDDNPQKHFKMLLAYCKNMKKLVIFKYLTFTEVMLTAKLKSNPMHNFLPLRFWQFIYQCYQIESVIYHGNNLVCLQFNSNVE